MIGILGGVFDPIHFGHIRPARQLLDELPLQEIRFTPCHTPPHKVLPRADPVHRWNMLTIVTDRTTDIRADDRELRRGGISYTIETLEHLRAGLGETLPLCWIMGTDAFAGLTTWYRWEELLMQCHLLIVRRPDSRLPDTGVLKTLLETVGTADPALLTEQPNGRIHVHAVNPVEISSTQIRRTIAAGLQPRYLLPGPVWTYIRRYGLYGAVAG